MTELEIAARFWKEAYEGADFKTHPNLWVCHFDGSDMLGSVHGTARDEPSLVLCLAAPFAVSSEVSDTFVFLDRPGHVLVTRIAVRGEGVQTTNWTLPYTFNDNGAVEFGLAENRWHPVEKVREACDDIARRRMRGNKYPFADAFRVAVEWGERIL